jgi:predicted NBD/HSP70 family sugar kinase
MSEGSHFRGTTAVETHGAILDLIRSSGIVSRTELIERTGLTGATITRIVRQLLDDGLIEDIGLGEATGGKRRTLLRLNPHARAAVGVSLDHDLITYTIADLSGQVVARQTAKGSGNTPPAEVTRRIAEEVDALITSSGVDPELTVGIGVAMAGRRGRDNEVPFTTSAPDWGHFALEEALGSATGYPVVVDNDATCAAVGEYWAGGLSSSTNFATVYMTSGFGLGLVTGGQIYRGASRNAGELGHVIVDPTTGPECPCGRRGCLHAVAGVERLVALAAQDGGLVRELGLTGTARTVRRDYAKLSRAAAAGQESAHRLVKASADHLASVLVSVTNVLDLDQFVLAGPGFNLVGPIYADTVARHLANDTWARSVHPVTVGLSAMGDDAAALGAASLVLQTTLTPRRSSPRLALTR